MAANREGSVLGEATSITGRISGDGDLEVRGRIDGEIAVTGDLVIAEGAAVKASLGGARVTIRGAVLGDVSGSDAIVLEASARVIGNLRAPRIAIALGAQIRGDLDMGDVALGEETRAARPAQRPAATPAAARPARAPLPPARPVVVTRKNPPPQPTAAAPASAPTPPSQPAKKGPPEPVVPAIKKGAKAVAKKKG